MLGLVRTLTLEPAPVPLNVKVVLLGDRWLYYILSTLDPDFPELFKVEADFDDRMERSQENEALFARLIAGAVKREELGPFTREAVAKVVERSARMANDSERLSVRTRGILDLVREAAFWAGEEDASRVEAEHVQKAIDQWTYRAGRIRDRMQEEIHRETIFIDTEGSETGQVNGLSVLQLGDFAFGKPSRITARVRLGKGEVIDIEREVELGGPIHSKGILILSGFLGGRYARDHPLSLSASLVFEQSYGGVEGDSASSAELYALLSALAEVPLKQSVAVTGSVNQRGEIQPVGGLTEKIEGFHDVCAQRGLTGEQGVLIPEANVKHLMLRDDVVQAVTDGRFHVWAVETVDQGMELLTGETMGRRENGGFPEGTLNAAVEDRLRSLSEARRKFENGSRERQNDG
jgi:lon-related putative ATP-dependent protease